MTKNKRNDEVKDEAVNDSPYEDSAVVKARRERLAREVGDASQDEDNKTYGVSDREKREDEK